SGAPAGGDRLAILEDYADPFDVQDTGEVSAGASGAPEKIPENDGYMEPYEAQKMMAEIRGSKEPSAQPLPLYDTPYEPDEEGPTPEGEAAPWPRESRLPEDDERPPEEYDQPWEWKKERISKAFAAQFEGSEKSCLSPGREEKGRPPPRLPAVTPKPAKPLGTEPGSPLGEWTDPALPLEDQVSSQGFMHMKLSRTKEHKYVLGQNSPPFSSVPEIVHHYASRKLPIKGAEHMSLLYPVAIRTL
uniref:Src homology 2 domain containing F n=1 Tax=Chinchilla lanigera TaxID=34839 RepID=A0A8C2VKR9_CHILA